jgi:hypothetical protein
VESKQHLPYVCVRVYWSVCSAPSILYSSILYSSSPILPCPALPCPVLPFDLALSIFHPSSSLRRHCAHEHAHVLRAGHLLSGNRTPRQRTGEGWVEYCRVLALHRTIRPHALPLSSVSLTFSRSTFSAAQTDHHAFSLTSDSSISPSYSLQSQWPRRSSDYMPHKEQQQVRADTTENTYQRSSSVRPACPGTT